MGEMKRAIAREQATRYEEEQRTQRQILFDTCNRGLDHRGDQTRTG